MKNQMIAFLFLGLVFGAMAGKVVFNGCLLDEENSHKAGNRWVLADQARCIQCWCDADFYEGLCESIDGCVAEDKPNIGGLMPGL